PGFANDYGRLWGVSSTSVLLLNAGGLKTWNGSKMAPEPAFLSESEFNSVHGRPGKGHVVGTWSAALVRKQ
ncbi:MAG: hypothetical protein FJ087_23795, partial [Deltaproteobacteria bacterium]|nr:hypothetical protein [Deltaproteobacteria bacterium]